MAQYARDEVAPTLDALSGVMSTFGNMRDRRELSETRVLQNQIFQAQIDKNEQQNRINKGASIPQIGRAHV